MTTSVAAMKGWKLRWLADKNTDVKVSNVHS